MLDCLVIDVLNLLSSMLELTEVINLSFVYRSLRDFAGAITPEDVLGYCIRDANLRLYYEYMNRLPVFPLRLAADLGRTGNVEMMRAAERRVFPPDLHNFRFNLARGLLFGGRHDLFIQINLCLDTEMRKAVVRDYFDNLRGAAPPAATIARYMTMLFGEHLTVRQLANIMRGTSDFLNNIYTIVPGILNRTTLQYAALEADSPELFSHYLSGSWEDKSQFYPFASLRLAKEVAIKDNSGEFYIGVLIHRHEIDLLLENIDTLYSELPRVLEYMFETLDVPELERILSHEKRYPDDFFRYLPRKREYFDLVLNHGYTLSACVIHLHLNNVKVAATEIVFNPPITSARDIRLGFLDLLEQPCQLVEFLIRYDDKIEVDYEELDCKETRQLLIGEKKLTARYCCKDTDSCNDWIAVRGVEDLNGDECMEVYYHFSTKVRLGKRERGDLNKLLEYVQRNKKCFVRGIIRARKSTFKYEVLEAILEQIADLSADEREEIENILGEREEPTRRCKRQKK